MGERRETVLLRAVQEDPTALYYIWGNDLTKEICLATVQKNPAVLEYVPKCMRKRGFYEDVARLPGFSLGCVPDAFRTREFCEAAVAERPLDLEYVPERMRTEEMCLAAVAKDGWAIEFVPEELRTARLCALSLKSGDSFRFEDRLRFIDEFFPGIFRDGNGRPLPFDEMERAEAALRQVQG